MKQRYTSPQTIALVTQVATMVHHTGGSIHVVSLQNVVKNNKWTQYKHKLVELEQIQVASFHIDL